MPLSQKNQKNFDMFFQESTFMDHIPDQTKPNQTKWYTTKASLSCQSLTKKKFSSIAPLGAEKIDLEVSKFEKWLF